MIFLRFTFFMFSLFVFQNDHLISQTQTEMKVKNNNHSISQTQTIIKVKNIVPEIKLMNLNNDLKSISTSSISINTAPKVDLIPQMNLNNDLKPMSTSSISINTAPKMDLIPKWPQIKKVNLPIFPIYKNRDMFYISILNKWDLDKNIKDRLKPLFEKNKDDDFSVEGKIVEDILKDLNISLDKDFFIKIFVHKKIEILKINDIKKLKILINGAGGADFGTIAIEIPTNGFISNFAELVGLAWVASDNPFAEDHLINESKFINTSLSLLSQNELEAITNQLMPIQEMKKIKFSPAKESSISINQWKLVETLLTFEPTKDQKQNLFGYHLVDENKILKIRSFYLDSELSHQAGKILKGKIFKEYDHVIIFPATGMGDCGKILILDKSDTWLENDIHCGFWGC